MPVFTPSDRDAREFDVPGLLAGDRRVLDSLAVDFFATGFFRAEFFELDLFAIDFLAVALERLGRFAMSTTLHSRSLV